MKEFISILISFIFMSLAESVDSFFNNSISLDAIIVCGSLFSINLIGRSIGEIGTYTYRVVRKREGSYLLITAIVSFVIGLLIFFSRRLLVALFDITLEQKELLSNILVLYVVYLPVSLVNVGLLEIVRLKGELKLYRNSMILFYFLLIGFDSIVFILTKNLILLYVATILASLINIIYLKIKFKLRIEGINKEDLCNVKKYGITLVTERLLSRIFILIYGVIASYMSGINYAIHTICYSVCLNLEIITNAYSAVLMIKIPEEKDKSKQTNVLKKYMKKCFMTILIIDFVLAGITLFIQHGTLPISDCFPYIIFYCCSVFGLFFYESYKAICVIQGQPKILLYGSIIGVVIRVLTCLLFLKTPICIYIFGISNFIDFYSRSIIYKIGLNKNNQNIRENKLCS